MRMKTFSLAWVLLVTATDGTGVPSFAIRGSCSSSASWSRLAGIREESRRTLQSAAATSPPRKDAFPPTDETYTLIGVIQELLARPNIPAGAQRYDGVGRETGGIWRTRFMGFIPQTLKNEKTVSVLGRSPGEQLMAVSWQENGGLFHFVLIIGIQRTSDVEKIIAAPAGTRWITKEEIAGRIVQRLPTSTVRVLGEKALSNLGDQREAHASARRVFNEALSPKAVAGLQPVVEASVTKIICRLDAIAASGEEVRLLDEINAFTLEVIARGFLGDYATEKILEDTARLFPILVGGIFSFPWTMPWPVNQFPLFAFGQSMEARSEFIAMLAEVVAERREDLASGRPIGNGGKSGGVVDLLLKAQQTQAEGRRANESGVTFDDEFIFDNIIVSLFAGYRTTAVTLARLVQSLASADGKATTDLLMQEICRSITTDDGALEDSADMNSMGSSAGIFESFPLLDAVVLESARLNPAVGSAYRSVVEDVSFNGYRAPAGSTLVWNVMHGFQAESVYPEPQKFCPFRFLHSSTTYHGRSQGESTVSADTEQPRPPMFGFGTHLCPGRELAKLEILLFLRAFLTRFDYDLVEGQNYSGTLPSREPKDRLRVMLKPRA